MKFKVGELRQMIKGLGHHIELELKDGNLTIVPQQAVKHRNRKIDYEEIIDLFKTGVGGRQIAEKLGCSHQFVYQVLEFGLGVEERAKIREMREKPQSNDKEG